MRRSVLRSAGAAALALFTIAAARAGAASDVPMDALRDELARSVAKLRLEGMDRPYFLVFRMDEREGFSVSAELGSLALSQPERSRRLGVEVRVGDYAFDNSNFMSANSWGSGSGLLEWAPAPLDDDYQQIRRRLWLLVDKQYKRALESLSAKRAAVQARARKDEVPDFTRAAPHQATETRVPACAPRPDAEALVRELSAVFREAPNIRRSSVTLECRDALVRYVNSEGTSFTRAAPYVKLEIAAFSQAASALPISDSIEIFARTMAELPPRKALVERSRALAARVVALTAAPSMERYNGPVLFDGVAAAELFAQQFGPGLVASRRPTSDDPRFELGMDRLTSQMGMASFADKLGARVLPAFLSVTDRPALDQVAGSQLLGGQRVDDDGVRGRDTKLVDHGTLKTLLATRTPTREVRASTGSRRGMGAAPSNLVVTSDRSLSPARLRKELLRRAKARGLDYVIMVRRIGAGRASPLFRMAARFGGSGESEFVAAMAEVVRVFADGREELLHGVELGDFTAAAFKDIAAVGDAPAVHTAEFIGGLGTVLSGGGGELPVVTCAVPPLLFDDVTLVASQGPFQQAPVVPSPPPRR